MELKDLIVPVALFLINLLIVLALRASDKKSRNFKQITKAVNDFRSEYTHTQARIKEVKQESIDEINRKKEEAGNAIDLIQHRLDTLKEHDRELAALQDVCNNYQITLNKLKLQTEQAENRISAVQKEVDRAEMIQGKIDEFTQNTNDAEHRLNNIREDYGAMITSTNESLNTLFKANEDRTKVLLSEFDSLLTQRQEELDNYIEKEKVTLQEGLDGLVAKNAELEASYEENIEKLKEELANINKSVTNSKENLGLLHTDLIKALNIRKDEIAEDVASYKAELVANNEEIKQDVDKYKAELVEQNAEIKQDVDNYKADLSNSNEKIKQDVDSYKLALNQNTNDNKNALQDKSDDLTVELNKLSEKLTEQMVSIVSEAEVLKEKVEETKAIFTKEVNDSKSILDSYATQVTSIIEKSKDDLEMQHKAQMIQITEDEASFAEFCKDKTVAIAKEEIEKINAVYNNMKSAVDKMLTLLATRQSEMKEIASKLNQGTNETIAATVDRLQTLQSKITATNESFSTTQETLLSSKEELLALQNSQKSLTDVIYKLEKERNEMKNDIERINRDREEEEKRLRDLRKTAEETEELINKNKKKANIEIEAFPEDITLPEDEEEVLDL